MALNKSILKTEIRKYADKEYSRFEEFPEDEKESAKSFSEAMYEYSKNIGPASKTVKVASETMATDLGDLSISSFISAFTSFATEVASGMAPEYTAVPPPNPIDFSSVSDTTNDAEKRIGEISNIVDSWLKTGTATPSGGGPTINWY